jgi:hypothetical protein
MKIAIKQRILKMDQESQDLFKKYGHLWGSAGNGHHYIEYSMIIEEISRLRQMVRSEVICERLSNACIMFVLIVICVVGFDIEVLNWSSVTLVALSALIVKIINFGVRWL